MVFHLDLLNILNLSNSLNMEHKSAKTPDEDLRRSALEHYDEVASKSYHHLSTIPNAINYYFDNKNKPTRPQVFFFGVIMGAISASIIIAAILLASN